MKDGKCWVLCKEKVKAKRGVSIMRQVAVTFRFDLYLFAPFYSSARLTIAQRQRTSSAERSDRTACVCGHVRGAEAEQQDNTCKNGLF